MRTSRDYLIFLILIIVATVLLGGLYWANFGFVQNYPGGGDFIVAWKSMRNFMLDSIPPYGELTSRNIQTLVYQRSLLPGQYPFHVNIPLFLLMFFIPLSWIKDLLVARTIWMIILEAGLFGVIFISMRLSHWRPHWILMIFIMLFGAFWLPSVSMLITGTSIVLQALLFYTALRSIELYADELAGALIALCLLNIEATGMVFLGLMVWIFSTQRWRILGGIGMTLVVLFSISLIFYPTWIFPFIGSTLANWQSATIPSTYSLFEAWVPGIGRRLAQLTSITALSIILFEWSAVRGQDVRWLFWTISLTATLTPLLGLPYFPQWTVFTLPAILLVVSVMVQRWKLVGLISTFFVLIGIFLGLWGAQLKGFVSIFILFYPIALTLLLYWVRWGAVRQPRLWADEILLRG